MARQSATVEDIAANDPASKNYNVQDAHADLAHAYEDSKEGRVYIPIVSNKRSTTAVSLLLVDNRYTLRDIRANPSVIQLSGPITRWDGTKKLPKLALPLDKHLSTLWMGRHTPDYLETSTMIFGAGVLLLSVSLWIIVVGRPLRRAHRARP